ncbi:hypothetical protein C823_002347 [Eubacterium plexicaudatum ASF492]|uniref:Uncharacterized protein n=1 Tax=Eubacterium plexicaudatum ASF492 TaxID=1235802 RepID=N2BLZ1_9FIRM|nr:hypothetical protein C823_002347 [Eubacterium plexicaudatum ASF492]
MPDWSRIGSLLDFCAAYYTTKLVRCAAFSFVLIGLVMLLRKMLFLRQTFIRGCYGHPSCSSRSLES